MPPSLLSSIPTLCVAVLTAALLLQQLHQVQLRLETLLNSVPPNVEQKAEEEKHRRIAWIDGQGKNIETGHMKHIFDAFRNIGYDIIRGCPPPSADWDVLWLHEYALSKTACHHEYVKQARWPQAINHVAGSGYYTSKVYLATAKLSSGVPLAFKLPSQAHAFSVYAKEHPEMLWVQKDNSHRNIKIRTLSDIDLQQSNSFVQKFVENPLLIDNRKFDLGVYTVVTSLDPLKVYVFEDILVRFCAKEYNPFDESDVDKYVVGDDYTPIWEIPSLADLYERDRLSVKDTFNAFFSRQGKDILTVWSQLEATIAEVFQSQQDKMLLARQSNPSDPKLFELSRFDFVVDEHLNVYLMEANMSPNLSSGHFKPNQLLYEQGSPYRHCATAEYAKNAEYT